jgi:hypothetical protein
MIRPFLFVVRSPDGAQRNPGTVSQVEQVVPDFASLHPGYVCRYAAAIFFGGKRP